MNQKTKAVIVLIVTTMIFLLVSSCAFIQTTNKKKAQKLFDDFSGDFILVSNCLMALEYDYIDIESAEEFTIREENFMRESVRINDEDFSKAIESLFSAKIKKIYKQNDEIIFLRWTRFNDFGAGIVFSNGIEEDFSIEYLTKIEQLSNKGWYYYEEDYNEWRTTQSLAS